MRIDCFSFSQAGEAGAVAEAATSNAIATRLLISAELRACANLTDQLCAYIYLYMCIHTYICMCMYISIYRCIPLDLGI